MYELTILTDPVLTPIQRIIKKVKRLLIDFSLNQDLHQNKNSIKSFDYGGHYAVTRSLVEGLKKIQIAYNYNPKSIKDLGETIVVLSGINTLKQAIKWKKNGKIKTLAAGPNIVVFSSEGERILTNQEIDICLVPSHWVATAYSEDEPSLQDKIKIWYAGVDYVYWNPKLLSKSKNVLVYWKTETDDFCKAVENKVEEHGWNPIRMTYGQYNQEQFKNTLDLCEFSIFISRSESQGIALAECWSMNIPTLVWNPQELIYQGRVYSSVSACPYLNNLTGIEWRTFTELDRILDDIELNLFSFHPRRWILESMSDEYCAKNLLKILQIKT